MAHGDVVRRSDSLAFSICKKYCNQMLNTFQDYLFFVKLKLLKLFQTLPLRALSLSQSSIALYSDSRASFLSLAASEWSSFKPSLATFWNFFPSNSGRACMQYSSTGSTKYKTCKKQKTFWHKTAHYYTSHNSGMLI